jgi:hypothetical protein
MEGSEISTYKDDKVFFNSRKYGYAELSEEKDKRNKLANSKYQRFVMVSKHE